MAQRVCIIGAGPAGLSCVKHCLDANLVPVCYEKDSDIGGVWHFVGRCKEDGPPMYESCVMNNFKLEARFSDFPVPKEYPNYLHHSLYLKYLNSYAEQFHLRDHIHCNMSVEKIVPSEDGSWYVTTKNILSSEIQTESFDFVLIANGNSSKTHVPSFPEQNDFKGKIIHSHEYVDFHGFEDKRVLVIGCSNSGREIAPEISRYAKHVYVSTRSGSWNITRSYLFGQPWEWVLGTRLFQQTGENLMLPFKYLIDYLRCDQSLYSLSPNGRRFDRGSPGICDDLFNRIMVGALTMKPQVSRFTEHDVIFDDGTREENIDIVILATGYSAYYPFLDDSFVKLGNRHLPELYKYVWRPQGPHTIAFIGQCYAAHGFFHAIELQARWAIGMFTGTCKLPSRDEMMQEIHSNTALLGPRDSMPLEPRPIAYCDSVASQIGCKPPLLKYFLTDPRFWYKLVFWPKSGSQYRLLGPGKWSGARGSIESIKEEMEYPLRTRKAGVGEKDGIFWCWIIILKGMVIFVLVLFVLKLMF